MRRNETLSALTARERILLYGYYAISLPAIPVGLLLTIYGTGLGPASTARPEGFPIPANPPFNLVDSISVQVGDDVIAAQNGFAVPGKVGIDAVQFQLDDSAPSGTTATLKLTVNGQDSNTVMLPIQ